MNYVRRNGFQPDILSDGSTVITNVQVEAPSSVERPRILCFHGSGDSAAQSWVRMSELLERDLAFVQFGRGSEVFFIKKHIRAVRESFFVSRPDPYILLAHLYGDTFAKQYLYRYNSDVACNVLMETGESREPTGISHRRSWNGGRD